MSYIFSVFHASLLGAEGNFRDEGGGGGGGASVRVAVESYSRFLIIMD